LTEEAEDEEEEKETSFHHSKAFKWVAWIGLFVLGVVEFWFPGSFGSL
jgi:hypothetical protein